MRPVIPVAMVYSSRKLPFGKKITRVQVRFGKPLDFSRYEGLSGDRFVERSITDEIMYEIMTLSGQEYVDVYGAHGEEVDGLHRRQRTRGRRAAAAAAGRGRRPRPDVPGRLSRVRH